MLYAVKVITTRFFGNYSNSTFLFTHILPPGEAASEEVFLTMPEAIVQDSGRAIVSVIGEEICLLWQRENRPGNRLSA